MRLQLIIIVSLWCSQLFAAEQTISSIMDSTLAEFVHASEPGCSIGYGKNDKVYYTYRGLSNLDSKLPIGVETRFLTASISKQMTSFLALLIAKEQEFGIDDDIHPLLPNLKKPWKITIRQLMNHTSGIADHWALFEMQGRSLTEPYTQQDALDLAYKNDYLEFNPGIRHNYSNGGYVVLADLVETLSKNSLAKNFGQYISKPLELDANYFILNDSSIATGYLKRKSGFKLMETQSTIAGPGNVVISIQGLAQWAKFLIDQINTNDMYRDGINNSKHQYFAGLYIQPKDEQNNTPTLIFHDGYYENNTQSTLYLPESNEYVVSMCNRADFRPAVLSRKLLTKLGSIPTLHEVSVVHDEPSALEGGLYYDSQSEKAALLFAEEGERYYYGPLVGSPKPLAPNGTRNWKMVLSSKTVLLSRSGPNQFVVNDPQNTFKLTKVSIENPQSSANKSVKLNYINPIVGSIKLELGSKPNINFSESFGEIPLMCTNNNLCFTEDGYLAVNAINTNEIRISTKDIQGLRFTLIE
jgi:CubicO group peptidase (beta-lactamase class C family)